MDMGMRQAHSVNDEQLVNHVMKLNTNIEYMYMYSNSNECNLFTTNNYKRRVFFYVCFDKSGNVNNTSYDFSSAALSFVNINQDFFRTRIVQY